MGGLGIVFFVVMPLFLLASPLLLLAYPIIFSAATNLVEQGTTISDFMQLLSEQGVSFLESLKQLWQVAQVQSISDYFGSLWNVIGAIFQELR